MSLREQFEALLKPGPMRQFAEQMVNFKIIRYHAGKSVETRYPPLGPFPSWFTLYDLKLALWNSTTSAGGERKAENMVFKNTSCIVFRDGHAKFF